VAALCGRLKAPADCRDLALLATRHANAIVDAAAIDAQTVLELFYAADLWRRPRRFAQLVAAALMGEPDCAPAQARIARAQTAVAAVDAGAIAGSSIEKSAIHDAIAAARLNALRRAFAAQDG
jgi:tRNA nucleotidyltransferase (CCA-adding enzyme)